MGSHNPRKIGMGVPNIQDSWNAVGVPQNGGAAKWGCRFFCETAIKLSTSRAQPCTREQVWTSWHGTGGLASAPGTVYLAMWMHVAPALHYDNASNDAHAWLLPAAPGPCTRALHVLCT